MRGSDLVVLSGLPGTGKSVLARLLAARTGATYLRIDTIESAVASTLQPVGASPVGYVAAERVAQDQLQDGRDVVVDAVNDVLAARRGWWELARRTASRLHDVEVVCSDPVEHRRRVEQRGPAWPGHTVPTWAQVRGRAFEPFTTERLVVDNLGDPHEHVAAVLAWVAQRR